MRDLYFEIVTNVKNNSNIFVGRQLKEVSEVYMDNFPIDLDDDNNWLDEYQDDIARFIYDPDFQFNDAKYLIELFKHVWKLQQHVIDYTVNMVFDYIADIEEDGEIIIDKEKIDKII